MRLSRADQHFIVPLSAIFWADIILSSAAEDDQRQSQGKFYPLAFIMGKRGNKIIHKHSKTRKYKDECSFCLRKME